jgi:hypothetical protein
VLAGGSSSSSFGFPAPVAAVVQSSRAAESWTVTAADVDAWLRTAHPGEAFVYAHGPQLVQGGAAGRVAALTQSGDVTPHHKRTADGGFDFIVRRCAPRPSARAPVCTADMLSVLVELQDAAMNRRKCPSDADLAHATGVAPGTVKWLVRRLEEGGFIKRQTLRTRSGPFRQVTVVATGATTAGPTA